MPVGLLRARRQPSTRRQGPILRPAEVPQTARRKIQMLLNDDYQFILRNDLTTFTERAFYELNPQTTFKPAPHVEVITTKLEAVWKGEIRRLIINLPPRHLK